MTACIVVRYGEIWLKGQNRSYFERALVRNIRVCLAQNHHPYESITHGGGRIIIQTPEACSSLALLPGIVSFSFAHQTDPAQLKECIRTHFLEKIGDTFCVRVKRGEKKGPTSQEFEQELGAYLVAETGKKVNLKNPQTVLGIELYFNNAYIFINHVKGLGGIPQIKEGKMALMVETEKDVIAGRLLFKRGCIPDVISVRDELVNTLYPFCPGITISVFTHLDAQLYDFVVVGDERSIPQVPLNKILLPLEGLGDQE